ncbi:hypothetical protein [Streptomyces sp. NEAU-H3]|uniref:hypothetical protein n=1 Tax=Streptomyces sp. NEAU-H3 TaxID=2720636 RepID=UPI00143A7D66|nr:hypothetical protein [Streptomyces sp. NEAU-H3]NJA56674.1 hypothetical protein [Streptomyces sp. NEAU-H3]
MPGDEGSSVANRWPAYKASLIEPAAYPPRMSAPETTYALVSPAGDLTWQRGTWYSSRDAVMAGAPDDGWGETGVEYMNRLPGVVFRYYAPGAGPDTRRMNKVANGMFWRLMAPRSLESDAEGEEEPVVVESSDRVIKARGPVAIIGLGGARLSAEERELIEETHGVVVAQLKGRGWL